MGKSSAAARELLRDGLRFEKSGQLDRALELYREARRDGTDAALLAESWRLESYAEHGQCAWDAALAAARRSVEIARAAGLDELEAEALNAEAAVHLARGHLEAATPLLEAMLELAAAGRVRGLALQNLGIIEGQGGDLSAAERRFEEAYVEFERAAYGWGQAHVLNNRVALALERTDHQGAARLGREAKRLAQAENDLDLQGVARLNMAEALMGLDQFEEAQREASTALGHFQVSGNRWRRIACLRVLGDVSQAQGDAETARAMWRHGLELAREIDARRETGELEARLGRDEATR
jgi:tetratricopeptide (TPR) repeat protein